MDNEQLIKDVIRWIITTKNTEMLDESDVDLVYKDYVTEKVGNVAKPDACPQLADVRDSLHNVEMLVCYLRVLIECAYIEGRPMVINVKEVEHLKRLVYIIISEHFT
jgi:hypothetical protein